MSKGFLPKGFKKNNETFEIIFDENAIEEVRLIFQKLYNNFNTKKEYNNLTDASQKLNFANPSSLKEFLNIKRYSCCINGEYAVDPQIYNSVIENVKTQWSTKSRSYHLLSGLLKCSCGKVIRYKFIGNKSGYKLMCASQDYKTRQAKRNSKTLTPYCGFQLVRAEEIEENVILELQPKLLEKEISVINKYESIASSFNKEDEIHMKLLREAQAVVYKYIESIVISNNITNDLTIVYKEK